MKRRLVFSITELKQQLKGIRKVYINMGILKDSNKKEIIVFNKFKYSNDEINYEEEFNFNEGECLKSLIIEEDEFKEIIENAGITTDSILENFNTFRKVIKEYFLLNHAEVLLIDKHKDYTVLRPYVSKYVSDENSGKGKFIITDRYGEVLLKEKLNNIFKSEFLTELDVFELDKLKKSLLVKGYKLIALSDISSYIIIRLASLHYRNLNGLPIKVFANHPGSLVRIIPTNRLKKLLNANEVKVIKNKDNDR